MAIGALGLVRGDAVLRGAASGAPLVVVAALLFIVVDGGDRGGGNGDGGNVALALPLTLVLLGGLFLAGFVAARHARGAPFTNGALAALTIVVTLQVLAVAVVAVRGRDLPPPLAVVFRLVVAYGTGLLGAVVASSRQRQAGAGDGS